MKRFLVGLAMLAAPMVGQAQVVEYQFTDFVNTARGFNTTLMFRNINSYADARITGIVNIHVGVSERVNTFCGPHSFLCDTHGGNAFTVGAVQAERFTAGGWIYNYNRFGEDSCVGGCQRTVFWAGSPSGFPLLGCPLFPATTMIPASREYAGRTCAADGLTGWFALNLTFSTGAGPLPFVADVGDFNAAFTTRELGANVTATPEPGTWGLMLIGLGVIGVVGRRRV